MTADFQEVGLIKSEKHYGIQIIKMLFLLILFTRASAT